MSGTTSPSDGGEAQSLVRAVYGALDLFSSAEVDLLSWAKTRRSDGPPEDLLPPWLSSDNQRVLAALLAEAGVINDTGEIDSYALRGFQRVVELLPHFRAEEVAREPALRPHVVLTVPPTVELPREARHLQRSLAIWISDALMSATRRVLLASPFWSTGGNEFLLDCLQTGVELGLPITLAGARQDSDFYPAMVGLAEALGTQGADVRVLGFRPPGERTLFHAKIAAGRVGYLGSANLTVSGLGEHVEVGMPLEEPDVERVWWLVDVLVKAGLLADQHGLSRVR